MRDYTVYDNKLDELKIYQAFPQLKPFIGANYQKQDTKVMFIGESHYLPPESTIHDESSTWYASSDKQLRTKEKKWIDTRQNVKNSLEEKIKTKAYSIYRNIGKAIDETRGANDKGLNGIEYVGFMNYFLRPAQFGVSIDRDKSDKEKAFANLCELIYIIDIRYLVFASRLAYYDFDWYYQNANPDLIKIEYIGVPHPGSSWWNRKSKKYCYRDSGPLTGKECLIHWLRNNVLFE